MQLLDQSSYASYRVPLGVPINPGSVSVYRSDDAQKQAVMTIFADGRVDINQTLYELRYESYGEKASLVLYQK